MVEVIEVTKYFGGVAAVQAVSFQVEPGKIVSIIGPNGAGKTTLFNLISGYIKPNSGRILLQGGDITGSRPSTICKQGLVRTFQIVKPFVNLTTLENVACGALNWTSSLADANEYSLSILEKVGLAHRKNDPASQLTLSGKKKLELARALATRPSVLMLDEVMAGLNAEESNQMAGLLQQIHQDEKITVLIIEHALNIVMSLSDKVIVLQNGEKIAEGTPQEVSQNEKTIQAYIGRKKNC